MPPHPGFKSTNLSRKTNKPERGLPEILFDNREFQTERCQVSFAKGIELPLRRFVAPRFPSHLVYTSMGYGLINFTASIGLFLYQYGFDGLMENGLYLGALTILLIYFATGWFWYRLFNKTEAST